MNNDISAIKKEACTGCMACYNICPHNAITMVEDKEGFKYPVIDKDKCTNCGLCSSCCAENAPPPSFSTIGYAAIAHDNSILSSSSSGGVFSTFANYILENNGYVCAAAFDENWAVNHIIINDKKDLDKLRRSKYVQSNINKFYKEIKKLLNNQKLVFFCGTPCQVDGLNKFLRYKKYDNLLTMDIYCHKAPSPLVYRKLLEECGGIENITEVNFRDKSRGGWKHFDFIIKNKNGKNFYNDKYMTTFVDGFFARECCYNCKYAKLPRVGDITGADFWGAPEKFDKDNKGTSILLINSKKGDEILNKVKNKFKILEKLRLKAFGCNGLVKQHKNFYRGDFFRDMEKTSLFECLDKYTDKKKKVIVYNLCYGENYGAILVAYAMQEILRSIGYLPYHINGRPASDSIAGTFINKYIAVSLADSGCTEYLHNEYDTFIVGSDQVWNFGGVLKWYNKLRGSHILPDISPDKKKIAYAASFGVPSLQKWKNDYELNAMKYYASLFDHVSVREYDGIDICKNELMIDSIRVLDPTLAADKEIWDNIAQNSKFDKKEEKYIAAYILDESEDKSKILSTLAEKYNYKIIYIDIFKNKQTPEDFVAIIKNAEYVVTDSFHGTCFSLIYNKQFLTIYNKERGLSRFKTLEQLFNINSQFVAKFTNENDVINIINNKIDYKYIKYRINEEKQASIQWLKNSIETPKENKPHPEYYMFEYMRNEIVHDLSVLANKNKILRKYQFYKILSRITSGDKQKYYEEKFKKYKKLKRELKTYISSKYL